MFVCVSWSYSNNILKNMFGFSCTINNNVWITIVLFQVLQFVSFVWFSDLTEIGENFQNINLDVYCWFGLKPKGNDFYVPLIGIVFTLGFYRQLFHRKKNTSYCFQLSENVYCE